MEGGAFGFRWWTQPQVNYEILLLILGAVAIFAASAFWITNWYGRRQRYKDFENEMKTLDLDSQQEGTLAEMVRRHQIGRPVQVLYSAKLFDDMASVEMRRILGSQGSAESKEHFIDTLYEIRTRTYHPDWVMEVNRRTYR